MKAGTRSACWRSGCSMQSSRRNRSTDNRSAWAPVSASRCRPDLDEAPDQLFRNADIALYIAKTDSRGGFQFFETAMQIELWQKQALRADLAGALDRGEFTLAFQPLLDLKEDRIGGFEALLRWRHLKRGDVPPDQFIPMAEETGLIVPIGEWALRTACAQAMHWPAHVSVAVNLSSRQFTAGDLPQIVKRVLEETGLPASRLELEITETVLLRDTEANMQMLRQLRDLGVRIALDDFGTGFSSLAYLQRFPFSKIKIDRTFISGLPDSEESQAIVRSVIGLGKSLGLRVTAEGVETEAQFNWVQQWLQRGAGIFPEQAGACRQDRRDHCPTGRPRDSPGASHRLASGLNSRAGRAGGRCRPCRASA